MTRHRCDRTTARASQSRREIDERVLARQQLLGELRATVIGIQLHERARRREHRESLRRRYSTRHRVEATAIGWQHRLKEERLFTDDDPERVALRHKLVGREM